MAGEFATPIRTVPVCCGTASLPAVRVTNPSPAATPTSLGPGPDHCAVYASVAAASGFGVHTLQIADTFNRTGWPPWTTLWVDGGHRRTGVSGPTCTGIDTKALRVAGSDASPSMTSMNTAPGPT